MRSAWSQLLTSVVGIRQAPRHRLRCGLWSAVIALLGLSRRGVAQDDTATAGPPPHFAAAWARQGALIDVSRMGALRNRVSLDLTAVPIDTAIAAVRERANLKLLYRADLLPAGWTVSVHAKDLTAASALAEVLLDTGIDVVMLQDGNLVLARCTHGPSIAGEGSGIVTGRVVDRATGMPLTGAIVTAEGTGIAASAGYDGRYRLAGLPTGPQTLTARYIGYTPATVTAVLDTLGAVQPFALEPSAQPLAQVVVTGTLVPTEVKALPTPITIITADEIRRQNVMRLDQLFRGQVAGALAWDRPGEDHYSIINVRGASSFSTLASVKTLIDGIEVDPQFTALMDPNSIERIELTRGPQASTMYGSNAISGVLQIFTKKGAFRLQRPEGEFRTSAGLIEKNDGPGVALRLQEALSVRGSEQHTRYQASAYYRHDGQWTPSYHNTNWSVTASAENAHGPLTSRITAMLASKGFDFPEYTALRDSGYLYFSKPLFQRFDVQTQTYGVNFTYTARPWWRHDLVLGYDRWALGITQTERRLTTPDDTLFLVVMNQRGKMSMSYFSTVSARLRPTIGATISAGFNYYSLGGSNALVQGSPTNIGTLDGSVIPQRLSSSNTGYFAQAQVNAADAVFVTGGLRAERNPDFGEEIGTVISPRVGAAYVRAVGPVTLKLRASYGESIRAPEPSQNLASVIAGFEQRRNPSLRPERQRGSDGGLDLHWGTRASLSVTYYHQKAIDLIDLVYDSTAGGSGNRPSQYQNVGSVRNRGWEIEARYGTNRLQISGALSLTSSRILQLDSAYSGAFRPGDRLFDIPRYRTGLTMAYCLPSGTTFRTTMTNVGRWVERDFIAFYGNVYGGVPPRPSDRDYWMTYSGFTRMRVGVQQQLWKNVVGALDVENITNNQTVEAHNATIPPPRTVTATFQISR